MRKKILVVAPQFLGDSVLSIPFFKNLYLFGYDIDVLTKNAAKLVLEGVPYISNVYDFDVDKKFLREQKYSKVYLLKRSLSALLKVFRCNIKEKIGFSGQFRAPFLSKAVKYDKNKHEIECFFDILRADGVDIVDTHLECFVDETLENNLRDYLHPSKKALVVACASTPVKNWNDDSFFKVVEFLKDNNYEVYFLGTKSEKAVYERISPSIGINLCGELSLKEVLFMISKMDMVVGLDSGFCHVSSAFNIPTLGLFGPMNLKKWSLLGKNSYSYSLNLPCSPCSRPKKCKNNYECMQKIKVFDIIEQIKKYLMVQ